MNIKKILKFVWNEFIYGGHLLSLGASSILCSGAIIFNKKVSIPLLIVGYTMAQIVYFYNHYKEIKKDFLTNSERVKHLEKTKNYFLIICILYCLFFIISLIYLNNLKAILIVLLIIFGGLLFTDFFKNFTKKITGFKNFYVAFFWALLIILAGVFYNIPFDLSLFLLFSFVFLRWLVNTTFFDIKDIESDIKENLKTIPILLGKAKTLNYLHIINIFSFLLIIISIYKNILPLFSLSLLVFYFYSFYYLQRAKNERIDVHNLSYIMVDGEYLFWPFILLFGKLIINL